MFLHILLNTKSYRRTSSHTAVYNFLHLNSAPLMHLKSITNKTRRTKNLCICNICSAQHSTYFITSNFNFLIISSAVMALVFIRDNISFVAIAVTEHKLTKLKLITSTPTLCNHMYCKLDATSPHVIVFTRLVPLTWLGSFYFSIYPPGYSEIRQHDSC